jgi:predicted ABC-type ATPase
MARAPLVVVLGGPNGAGKTTAAADLLRGALGLSARGRRCRRWPGDAGSSSRAGATPRELRFETTLAGRGHARWLQQVRATGYRAHLVFLSLPAADLAVARVVDRVRRGGHHVPEEVVRRRFHAGIRNLFEYYLPAVDRAQVYDNSGDAGARLIASWTIGEKPEVIDTVAWDRLEEQAR